jgi:galactose mutarotase-like enzyme
MKVLIENQYLTVESKPTGAELTSIKLKADGTEYLWQADPKFWNRHAPLLFPIVGSVANNQYTYDGKQYTLKNHGFARDAEFEIAHESEASVVYRLKDNAATQAAFPFRFKLEIGYTLKDNAVAVSYRVVNEDEKVMYFSIGAHPAFNCPIAAGDSFTDYYLEFSDNETLDRGYVNGPNLLIAGKTEPFFKNEKVKPVTEGMFSDGAYIFDHLKSTSVALKGRKTAKSVTVSFPGFPQLGIWSMPDAPYVCIEPWYGISESTDFTGDLTQKKGVLQLQPGKEFKSEYKIIIE